MSWKSWVVRAGSYAAAPWTGGASIPVGEAIAQGLDSNEAIDSANKAQQEATDKAVAEQQRAGQISTDIYNNQRDTLRPYVEQGGQAFSTLGGLMGFSPSAGSMSAAPSVAPAAPPTARQPIGAGTMPASFASQGPVDPRGQTLAGIQQGAQAQRQSSYGASGLVSVRAPNGNVYQVPRNRVAEAVQNGGQEL